MPDRAAIFSAKPSQTLLHGVRYVRRILNFCKASSGRLYLSKIHADFTNFQEKPLLKVEPISILWGTLT
jgi:hypothetical protein